MKRIEIAKGEINYDVEIKVGDKSYDFIKVKLWEYLSLYSTGTEVKLILEVQDD